MFYYKLIKNNEVVQIGTQGFKPSIGEIITETEYNELLAEFEEKAKQEEPTTDPEIDSIISEVANNGY